MTSQHPPVPHAPQIRRILLPIEGSAQEDAAIAYAALLAVALGASITVVHIDELPSGMVGIVPGASVDGDLAVERTRSTLHLEQAIAALTSRKVAHVEPLHVTATGVATALVELARREAFDLIVMATHARTGVARAVLGSVTEHVLRRVACPVLTIHTTT